MRLITSRPAEILADQFVETLVEGTEVGSEFVDDVSVNIRVFPAFGRRQAFVDLASDAVEAFWCVEVEVVAG